MTSEVTCHPSWSSCHPSWSSCHPFCHPPPFCNRPTPSVSWRRQNPFKMRNLNLRLYPPSRHNCPMHLRQTKDSNDKGTYYVGCWTRIGYVGSSSYSFLFFCFLSTSAFSPSSPVTGLESRRLKGIWRRRRRSPSVRSFSRRVSSASERSPHEATCSQFLLVLALPGNGCR